MIYPNSHLCPFCLTQDWMGEEIVLPLPTITSRMTDLKYYITKENEMKATCVLMCQCFVYVDVHMTTQMRWRSRSLYVKHQWFL